MLIRFKISNFLSFSELQEISMISGAVKNKEEHLINANELKLLNFSAIYGANASGKTNLLKAIDFSKHIILNGLNANVDNLYCRSYKDNKLKTSTFDCEIIVNEKCYSYGFDILLSENSIKEEWLYELKKDKEIKIYSRKINEDIDINKEYFNNSEEILNRLAVYASDIKIQDNVLLLTVMNKNKDILYNENKDNNITVFKNIYNWFKNVLTVVSPQSGIDNTFYLASEQKLDEINDIISTFGTGISKCKIVDTTIEDLKIKVPPDVLKNIYNIMRKDYQEQNNKEQVRNVFFRVNKEMYIFEIHDIENIQIKKMVIEHKNDQGEYLFEEESDGTIRLFDLIEILLNNDKEKVYFIDELDRCLHPQLTYEFVRRFLNNANNKTQLVVTTHESRLLNFDLLRRDEIWFANRENNEPTHLYSLEDYNERFDKKIDKAYLEGRYGGVPIFETLFPIRKE